MPHSGAVNPPQASPSLVAGRAGQGASAAPPPPPTRRLSSVSPAHTPPANREQDPFLAQTAAIPLSERDRQEGYDVELLNARPRGRYSSDLALAADGDDDSLGREKYGAGLVSAHSHPALADSVPLAATAGAGALGAAGGASLGPVTSGGLVGPHVGVYGGGMGLPGKEYGPDSAGAHSGTTAQSGRRRRPWYYRPLTLVILALFLVAVALAVGLGVGLSNKAAHSSPSVADPPVNSTSRSRLSSYHSRTNTASTGTVVPSSDTSYWSSLATATTSSVDPAATESDSLAGTTTLPSSITTIPSPITATSLATTGNLPIPANSSTIINGLTISVLPHSDETSAARKTSAARLRRTMSFSA